VSPRRHLTATRYPRTVSLRIFLGHGASGTSASMAPFVRGLQQAGERADQLSKFATFFGEPRLVNEQLARYRAVSAADVNAFASARLGDDNRASLVYVPRVRAAVEATMTAGADA